jgi:hypothetical protein
MAPYSAGRSGDRKAAFSLNRLLAEKVDLTFALGFERLVAHQPVWRFSGKKFASFYGAI